MRFREIWYDGVNGWRKGELHEFEIKTDNEGGQYVEFEDMNGAVLFQSRNEDGLFEEDSGEILLVPCEDPVEPALPEQDSR